MRTALRVKFPDDQGRYREFLRFGPPWALAPTEKLWSSLGFLSKFSTQPNRELFWRNREFFRRNREFSGRSREIHLAGGAARNSCVFRVDGVLRWVHIRHNRLEPGSPAEAGAGRDRQSDRDLTLGWVRGYESAVCKVKKEIPAEMFCRSS